MRSFIINFFKSLVSLLIELFLFHSTTSHIQLLFLKTNKYKFYFKTPRKDCNRDEINFPDLVFF